MRHFLFFLLFLFSRSAAQAQDDVNLSSIRIGPYKIGMTRSEAEKIAGVKLRMGTEANNYNDTNVVLYGGERIYIAPAETYFDNDVKRDVLVRLWTRSAKFRTKAGIGVGSSRQEVIEAYKTFVRFSMEPDYDDNGKLSRNKSMFTLYDTEGGSAILFYMVDNVVREIRVYKDYGDEGC